MGELIRRAGALVRTSPRELALRGDPARSTASIAFDGTRLTWADLPGETHKASGRATAVVGEAVQADVRHRLEDGREVEVATGWRLHEDGVVLVEVARPLRAVPGRPPEPAGRWQHRWAWHVEAAGDVRRRRGVVPVAEEVALSRDLGDKPARAVPIPHQVAADAWRYLPAPVRDAAEALVPNPVVWLGEITQRSSGDGMPISQEVRCLLMSEQRALTVLASRSVPGATSRLAERAARELARTPWVVEQVGFDLATPPALPGATEAPPLPW